MIIRYAKSNDLSLLVWEKSLEEYKSTIERTLQKSLHNENLYLVADLHGKIVGQIVASLPKNTTLSYISALRVQEKYRNKGIGTMLIQSIERKLKEKKYKKVFISVRLDNHAAKRLYEKFGYRKFNQRIDTWTYIKDNIEKTFAEDVYDLEKKL